METLDDVLLEADDKMNKSAEFLHQELGGLRTGKASPNLLDSVSVEYYGTQTRLKQIANVSAPEPRLLTVTAFDPTSLPAIEKAILAANLGVTPMNDGRLIRIPIPELSEERRKDLIKVAGRLSEEARVAVRSVRRDANDRIKALQKDSKITEDERDQALEQIQSFTDDNIKKIDDMLAVKEKDIMSV